MTFHLRIAPILFAMGSHLKKIIHFVTPRDKYTLSWNKKAYKISPKFPIYFVSVFLFQLRVYFVVYISNIDVARVRGGGSPQLKYYQ